MFSSDSASYGTDKTFDGHQSRRAPGARFGNLSLSVFGNHLDSYGQPMSYGTATLVGGGGTAVTGFTKDKDPTGADRVIVSAYGMDHTVQDVGKLRPFTISAATRGWR